MGGELLLLAAAGGFRGRSSGGGRLWRGFILGRSGLFGGFFLVVSRLLLGSGLEIGNGHISINVHGNTIKLNKRGNSLPVPSCAAFLSPSSPSPSPS